MVIKRELRTKDYKVDLPTSLESVKTIQQMIEDIKSYCSYVSGSNRVLLSYAIHLDTNLPPGDPGWICAGVGIPTIKRATINIAIQEHHTR